MRRRTIGVLVWVSLLLVGLLNSGAQSQACQGDNEQKHECLKKLLLTEAEVSETLGGTWILDQIGRLKIEKEADLGHPELGNPVSAFGIYLRRGRTRDDILRLITVLLQYPSEQGACELFAKGLISAIEPDNPVELPAEVVKPVQEALKDVADDVQFFKYEDKEETWGLAFRKGVQVGVFRAKLTAEQFVLLARKQLEVLVKGR